MEQGFKVLYEEMGWAGDSRVELNWVARILEFLCFPSTWERGSPKTDAFLLVPLPPALLAASVSRDCLILPSFLLSLFSYLFCHLTAQVWLGSLCVG